MMMFLNKYLKANQQTFGLHKSSSKVSKNLKKDVHREPFLKLHADKHKFIYYFTWAESSLDFSGKSPMFFF